MTELTQKEWFYEESQRRQVTPRHIQTWLYTGRYPGLQVRRVNQRVVLIQTPTPAPVFPIRLRGIRKPRPSRAKILISPAGSMPMKDWLAAEAIRCGVKPHTIYMRLARGRYPYVNPITVGTIHRHNFVMA